MRLRVTANPLFTPLDFSILKPRLGRHWTAARIDLVDETLFLRPARPRPASTVRNRHPHCSYGPLASLQLQRCLCVCDSLLPFSPCSQPFPPSLRSRLPLRVDCPFHYNHSQTSTPESITYEYIRDISTATPCCSHRLSWSRFFWSSLPANVICEDSFGRVSEAAWCGTLWGASATEIAAQECISTHVSHHTDSDLLFLFRGHSLHQPPWTEVPRSWLGQWKWGLHNFSRRDFLRVMATRSLLTRKWISRRTGQLCQHSKGHLLYYIFHPFYLND